MCGRLCDFPAGFELDHKLPLFQGGEDTEENCQVLCAGLDGCHAAKTAAELG
ncbi:MAG: HNH endonuclease [Pseudomonas sp.]|uniref:HNH endonuclease n=1 Tax=Pseudomonas sp. TaxID=306 RepID=UPI003BB5E299